MEVTAKNGSGPGHYAVSVETPEDVNAVEPWINTLKEVT